MRLFVFGMGYTAQAFVGAARDRFERVTATIRDPAKAESLARDGIATAIFDGTAASDGVKAALAEATHVLASVPPGDGQDPVIAQHGQDIAASPRLRWLGYLSTVGVYGDYGGAWVSERTSPHPPRGRAVRRVAAERAWAKLAAERQVPLGIFRLAGIYGPGRNTFVNLAEGKAQRIVKPGQVFNRIHVEDIAATLLAALDRPASATYNVGDDEPAPPQEVVAFAAGLMGVAPPPEVPFETADLSPMARSFYGDNRRILNQRIKQDLGVRLRYPTYRDGLSALWQENRWR